MWTAASTLRRLTECRARPLGVEDLFYEPGGRVATSALQPLVDTLKDAILAHRVLHADETLVAMLKPGTGKTHRAYRWAYTPGAFEGMKAVVYDFADSRAGQHAQDFLGEWRGALVCDDYSGYKALLAKGVVKAGRLAHARRRFVELHTANKSQIAEAGIQCFAGLTGVESPKSKASMRAARLLSGRQRLRTVRRL